MLLDSNLQHLVLHTFLYTLHKILSTFYIIMSKVRSTLVMEFSCLDERLDGWIG